MSDDKITVQWHGHACFSIEYEKIILVTDPHDGFSLGIDPPSARADIILLSHGHYDHRNGLDLVKKEDSKIIPNRKLQTKPPWSIPPYSETWVESRYLFPIAKSTELVPFVLFDTPWGFLPIERNSLTYEAGKIGKR